MSKCGNGTNRESMSWHQTTFVGLVLEQGNFGSHPWVTGREKSTMQESQHVGKQHSFGRNETISLFPPSVTHRESLHNTLQLRVAKLSKRSERKLAKNASCFTCTALIIKTDLVWAKQTNGIGDSKTSRISRSEVCIVLWNTKQNSTIDKNNVLNLASPEELAFVPISLSCAMLDTFSLHMTPKLLMFLQYEPQQIQVETLPDFDILISGSVMTCSKHKVPHFRRNVAQWQYKEQGVLGKTSPNLTQLMICGWKRNGSKMTAWKYCTRFPFLSRTFKSKS